MRAFNQLAVPCPGCGRIAHFTVAVWADSIKAPSQLLGCHRCKQVSPGSDWHRAYERRVMSDTPFAPVRAKEHRS